MLASDPINDLPHRRRFPVLATAHIASTICRPLSSQVIAMPDPGATDSMDLQARAHAQLGLTRQFEQTWREMPHPRRGGRGYDT
jgi:hypothetical protein